MKIGNGNFARFEHDMDRMGQHRLRSMGLVYASQRALEGDGEHDGRGLLFAIGLCMTCWGALGFFLLS
ncbi:hypothetical protein WSK_0930 [Novosphingobium sp. Rr 2-17]|uniref:hypothetical protein n=1 Tax=Novosphingobium sp. Rr 2-17 TaxID=555793 RepID=UPI00026991A4|nr:hypothetical protein [Novosphingobium sp. Rr 2-17]EIZ80372.1 hypothetical protein WSK_0930 [Novosphingobium sp. Rr 2-17]